MQQQRDSLQSLLAQQEQCLTQRQRKVSDMATQLVQLRQSQQQERQQAQVQANLHNRCLCKSSSRHLTSMRTNDVVKKPRLVVCQEQLDSSRKLLNHLLEEQEHRELR